MPPTKSVWMSEEDARLWDSLPKGQRSEIFKKAFSKWKSESIPEEKSKLLERLQYLQKRGKDLDQIYAHAEATFFENEDEILLVQEELRKFNPSNLVNEKGEISPDPVRFYNTFLEHAQKYLEEGTIFRSPSGQNSYRVQAIKEGKVFIERIDSKSPNPSSFTYETVRKAVGKLREGRFYKVGEFMPVLAQECAVTHIHPDMSPAGTSEWGGIMWRSQEVTE